MHVSFLTPQRMFESHNRVVYMHAYMQTYTYAHESTQTNKIHNYIKILFVELQYVTFLTYL